MKISLKKIYQSKWTLTSNMTPSNVIMKYRSLMHFTNQYNSAKMIGELSKSMKTDRPFVGDIIDNKIHLYSKVLSYWSWIRITISEDSDKTKVMFHFRWFWIAQLFLLAIFGMFMMAGFDAQANNEIEFIIFGLIVYIVIQYFFLKLRLNVISFIEN